MRFRRGCKVDGRSGADSRWRPSPQSDSARNHATDLAAEKYIRVNQVNRAPLIQPGPKVIVPRHNGLTRSPDRPKVT